ncbi:unnamed protein product [Phytophthora fragariaefolia]|uniref:Unnamed protein product n=1 Tax=Phytophthora fragariaefolia TaxID=1490495 RepID=A0A9W6TNY3_9STRA|nr:unnamed protein product [Phytophthora fragariaefolia]
MSSDSDSTDEGEARPQPNWCNIWRSTASGALDMFRSTISMHGIHKSDTTNCRALLTWIFQSSEKNNTVCRCRYQFKICLSSGTTEAFQYDRHIVDTSGSVSPSDKKLTPAMKEFIIQQLSSGVKTTAARLFAVICSMVQACDMEGPLPKDQLVTDFVKNWRRKNPKDQMAPMVEICDGHLYEQQNLSTLSDSAMLILCDSQPDSRPGSDHMVSHLGDRSAAFPFHVGMTCLRQILLCKDATIVRLFCMLIVPTAWLSMAILCLRFGTVIRAVNFCPWRTFELLRKENKILAGVSDIKRICMEVCGVRFEPEFFHVMQNVWKHATQLRLSYADTRKIFADLYDMHYTPREKYETVKAQILAKCRGYEVGSAMRKLTDHVIKQWVETQRFAKWQALYTPRGYAATNNPLERYHRRLKLECSDGKHTPDELIKSLDRARLAFLDRNVEFCNFSSASERLMLLRKQIKGMPEGGWIVDTRSKACTCLYFEKHGACCHLVAAFIQAGVHMPGVGNNHWQFVHPRYRSMREVEYSDQGQNNGSEDEDFSYEANLHEIERYDGETVSGRIAENELAIQSSIEESICNDSLDLQSPNPTLAYQGDRGSPVCFVVVMDSTDGGNEGDMMSESETVRAIKYAAMVVLLVNTAASALLPLWVSSHGTRRAQNVLSRKLSLATTSVFLGSGLLHLLPGAAKLYDEVLAGVEAPSRWMVTFPSVYLHCALGCSAVWSVDLLNMGNSGKLMAAASAARTDCQRALRHRWGEESYGDANLE